MASQRLRGIRPPTNSLFAVMVMGSAGKRFLMVVLNGLYIRALLLLTEPCVKLLPASKIPLEAVRLVIGVDGVKPLTVVPFKLHTQALGC